VAPGRRLKVGRSRIVAAAAALVLVVGGAAFALSRGGGDGNNGDDGVASIDGNGSNNSNSSGTGKNHRPSQAEMQDAALKYADCMRKHGVNMPDPKFDENGGMKMTVGAGPKPGQGDAGASAARKKMETADKACRHFMDDVAPQQDLTPEQVAEMQDKQTKLAECMRGKGYDMPDPQVDDQGRVKTQIGRGPNGKGKTGNEEQFRKDMETCSKKAGLNGGQGGFGAKGGA
jgi:hypothetical protein